MSKWVAGSRTVPALLAACTVTPGARRRIAAANGAKASRCASMNARSPSAVAKWVIAPARTQRRPGLQDPVGDGQRRIEVARAEPAHPGVELDVHPDGRRGGPPQAATNSGVQATTSAPAARAIGSSSALSAPITSTGASIPARSQLGGLERGGHRQARGAGGQRRPRDRHRAVAGRVGLDHRAQLGAAGQPRAQRARRCARSRPG